MQENNCQAALHASSDLSLHGNCSTFMGQFAWPRALGMANTPLALHFLLLASCSEYQKRNFDRKRQAYL